jgi:lysophospholipase L1-like esterase
MRVNVKRHLLIAVLLLTGAGVRAVPVSPANTNIQYRGRWNFSNPSVPWVYWQGSSILVNFDGTGISLDIEAESSTEQYRIVLDGVVQPDRLYVTGRETNALASGLAPGIHTLQIMKETWYGDKTFFHGLEVTGSGLVAPPPRPTLRIEFFGDSNMDGSSNYSERDSGNMGSYYAFPAMVTRMLGAEMNLQAVGGATLDNNGDNDVRSFIFSEDYYNQHPGYRSGFDPDIIVINAGANDVGAGKAAIKNRYKAVISDLRTVYGSHPHIVLFNAYGWDVNEPAEYTREVVDEVGGNLSACLFPWIWEQWHGCQWDHSGEAHQLMDHLAAINPAWVQVAANDIIDGFGRNFDVANGGFEHQAPFGGFGWRYKDDGVARINDPDGAAEGSYYIRLEPGEMVHQAIDATGDALPGGTASDQVYYVSAMIRGTAPGAWAQINADFEGQQMYNRGNGIVRYFGVSTEWQRFTTTFTAPNGSWKTFFILRSALNTVEFDHVQVSNRPLLMTGNPDPSTFHLFWQSAPGETYRVQSTESLSNSWSLVDTVIGTGSVVTGYTDTIGVPRRFFRLEAGE